MGEDTKTTERKIRITRFDYTNESGEKIAARRGEVVGLSDEDVARGEKIRAFHPVDQEPESTEKPTLEELVDWIIDENPNVKDVVERSKGDLEIAKLLVEAEKEATDGDPRKGVIDGLAQVLSAASE